MSVYSAVAKANSETETLSHPLYREQSSELICVTWIDPSHFKSDWMACLFLLDGCAADAMGMEDRDRTIALFVFAALMVYVHCLGGRASKQTSPDAWSVVIKRVMYPYSVGCASSW